MIEQVREHISVVENKKTNVVESSDVPTVQTDDFLACTQASSDLNVEPQPVVK